MRCCCSVVTGRFSCAGRLLCITADKRGKPENDYAEALCQKENVSVQSESFYRGLLTVTPESCSNTKGLASAWPSKQHLDITATLLLCLGRCDLTVSFIIVVGNFAFHIFLHDHAMYLERACWQFNIRVFFVASHKILFVTFDDKLS